MRRPPSSLFANKGFLEPKLDPSSPLVRGLLNFVLPRNSGDIAVELVSGGPIAFGAAVPSVGNVAIPGKGGNAIFINGARGYASRGIALTSIFGQNNLNDPNSFTLAARVNVRSLAAERYVISFNAQSGSADAPTLSINSTGSVRGNENSTPTVIAETGAGAIVIDKWHDIVWTHHDASASNRIWINGVEQALATNAAHTFPTNSIGARYVLRFGERSATVLPMLGAIEYTAWWTRELTTAEIVDLYGDPYQMLQRPLLRRIWRATAPAAAAFQAAWANTQIPVLGGGSF